MKNDSDVALQIENKNSVYTLSIGLLLFKYDNDLRKQFDPNINWRWNFWNAVFYAGIIFTTIGYGHLICKTTWGCLATKIYALIGIPMMLVVLNLTGRAFFEHFQIAYKPIKGWVRFRQQTFLKRTATIETVISSELYGKEAEAQEPEDNMFQTFPLSLAILLVFIFIGLCSILFSYLEDWDLFTAFYFFFISFSTIGFGDIILDHPRYVLWYKLIMITVTLA